MEPEPTYVIPGTFILALDASTTAVGWCYARDGDYIASDVYKPKGENAWERIDNIWQWTYVLIRDCDVSVVAVEEPMGRHGNARTDRLLGAVIGVIRAACKMNAIPCVLIHPMKVKATGFSKDALEETGLLVGQKVKSDQADAIGVWQAYLIQRMEEQAQ